MKNVVILGSGAVAAELTFYINDNNAKTKKDDQINIKGYIDYDYNIEKYYKRYNFNKPIICDIDRYKPSPNESVLIGISDIDFRNKMIDILLTKNVKIGSFIHHVQYYFSILYN